MKKEDIQIVINKAVAIMKEIGVSSKLEPVVFSFLLKELWNKHQTKGEKPKPEQSELKEPPKEEFSAKMRKLAGELGFTQEELEEIFVIRDGEIDITLSNLGLGTESSERQHLCHIYLTLKARLFNKRSASYDELKKVQVNYGLGDEHRQLSSDLRRYAGITVTGKKRSKEVVFRLTPKQVESGVKLIKNLVQPIKPEKETK